MSDPSIIFFFVCAILLLLSIIFYQQHMFKKGIQEKWKRIGEKLSDILDKGSDEQVMVFTDNEVLKHVSGQINRLLLDRQEIKMEFRKQQLSTKKMLANISHDIKTPLTVILGYLEMMQLEGEENESLQKVSLKAKQVMELIDQFFTLAKLEAGDVKIELANINISELCRETVLGFYDLLLQNKFTVELDIPEQNIYVQGEKESIERIINNLLSNAIRYGGDGKYVGLCVREEADVVCIDIVDKGKGIEREFADRVFERLYTTEDSRNRRIQGNGLGLTIAKSLAGQMGGDLLLESEPNVKTVFTVQLKKISGERNL